MQYLPSSKGILGLVLMGTVGFGGEKAVAQIVPDDTLGDESSVVVPDVKVNGLPSDQIEGGALRGELLFHSFEDFSVPEGRGAYFANPAAVNTIFSRVTGVNASEIFGTLGVLGDADLVFLNPKGILFGPNARLDLRGSFTGSTASGVELPNGEVFSALVPEVPSLLNLNTEAPIGLVFEGANAQAITNEGILVAPEDLTLAADNLNLQGQLYAGQDLTLQAEDTVQIRDSEVSPFIAASGNQLTVQGDWTVDIFALNHPDSGLFSGGDMTLQSSSPVNGDAHYFSGGSFQIETSDGSVGSLLSPVDPIIRALGDVAIGLYEGSSLHILAGGSVDIGTAIITEPDAGTVGVDFLQETIELSDGTIVEIDGGAQPTLDVRAGIAPEAIGMVPLENPSGVDLTTDISNFEVGDMPVDADITLADVRINAANGLVLLTNQYQPNKVLVGDIFITGNGAFGRGIDARGLPEFRNQGGAVYVDSRNNITLINSYINTSGTGNVGDIVINAEATIRFDRQGEFTGAVSPLLGEGSGGNIVINANNVDILNGAALAADTVGNGDAGNIEITARNRVRFDGSFAFSNVNFGAIGNAGDVVITTDTLEVLNGSQLISNTLSNGDAGDVEITARGLVRFEDSRAVSDVTPDATGTAGNVKINANVVELVTSGLFSSTFGNGDAGNVEIAAQDLVRFDNSIAVSGVSRGAKGTGGNVVIDANAVEVLNGGGLLASTFGNGDAGNVEIAVSTQVTFNNSSAFSRVQEGALGNGGNVVIDSNTVEILNGGGLLASTFGDGDAGNVEVTASDLVRFKGTTPNGEFTSAAFSRVNDGATGAGGNVVILADSVEVLDGAALFSNTLGNGNAGNVEITARNRVRFEGTSADGQFDSAAFSNVFEGAVGSGGNIVIDTNVLEVFNGAQLRASTTGNGSAGDIEITARDRVVFNDGNAFSSVNEGALGNGGNLVIDTYTLEALNGAQLLVSTESNGDAGRVEILAREQVNLLGANPAGQPSGIFATSNVFATGQSNDIQIATPNLAVREGAVISASTRNPQPGGDILLSVSRLSILAGGQVVTSSFGSGAAGTIQIDASEGISISGNDPNFADRAFQNPDINLLYAPQSRLSVQSSAAGSAGNIVIGAAGTTPTVLLDDGGQIIAESATVDGGNITLNLAGPLLLRNGSLISATAGTSEAGGNGGNIFIESGTIFAVPQEDSDIIANAFEGNGGQVTIIADGIFGLGFRNERTPFSDITASSEQGAQGTVTIETLEIDPNQGLAVLPEEPQEVAIIDSCQTTTTEGSVALFNLGQGGSPPSPDRVVGSYTTSTGWISLDLLDPNSNPGESNLSQEIPKDTIYSFSFPDDSARQLIMSCR